MKKLLIACTLASLTGLAVADTNLRLEPHFTVFGSLSGGADFYLDEHNAIGVNLFSTSDRGKLGLRYTKHWQLESSNNWLMVIDANAIVYEGEWVEATNETPTKVAGELRAMQQYRWQWSSGFNTTLGLGAFAIIDPEGEYDSWYTGSGSPLPVYGLGEWSVGWRF
ncbi:hypothetical protein [Salinibius halmophilus]|uniref:hypothetical protein n=1 Tax=Salinibius halmophilus TaxID=1853216 RepID=UPI000E6624F5|nr:hypothetical protein [Salinibius halmophilus]